MISVLGGRACGDVTAPAEQQAAFGAQDLDRLLGRPGHQFGRAVTQHLRRIQRAADGYASLAAVPAAGFGESAEVCLVVHVIHRSAVGEHRIQDWRCVATDVDPDMGSAAPQRVDHARLIG